MGEQARMTVTTSRGVPCKSWDPTRLFAQRDRLPWLWFGAAALAVLFSAFDRWHLVKMFKTRERVVIIDPAGTYYLSPLLKFEEARELHAGQATLATLALLERNPLAFDHPDLLQQMFLKGAYENAVAGQKKELPEFRSKGLHQKAEIGKIEILGTRENEVLVHVSGQVIRTGVFENKPFTEGFPYSLRLRLVRNPNMAMNGRFPTAVAEFKYEVLP